MTKKHPLVRLVRLVFFLFALAAFLGGLYLTISRKLWAISWFWATFIALLSLLLTYVPDYLKYRDVMLVPAPFQLAFTLFIFLSMFLGNLMDFYHRIPWWDSMLHFGSGILFSLAGLLLLISLIREPALLARINPAVFFLFSLVFSLACGAVWEIFEFVTDALLGMNMQRWQSDLTPLDWMAIKSISHRSNPGLMDTMLDLIAGSAGALLASFLSLPVIRRISDHSAGQVTSAELAAELRQRLLILEEERTGKRSPVSPFGERSDVKGYNKQKEGKRDCHDR